MLCSEAEMKNKTVNKKKQLKIANSDILAIVKRLSSDVFHTKIAKTVLTLLVLIHGSILLIEIFSTLFKPNIEEFALKAPIFFGLIYPTSSAFILLINPKLIDNFPDYTKIWNTENIERKVYQSVKRSAKITVGYTVATISLSVICGTTYVQFLHHENEIFFAYQFFDDFFPKYSLILKIIYKSTFPIMGYIAIVHPMQTIYGIEHIKYQIMLVKSWVEKINSDEENLFYSETYQKSVRKQLVNCIQRHASIITFLHEKIAKEVGSLFLIVIINSGLCFMSILLFMLSGSFYREYYLRLGLTCFTAGFVGLAGIFGQQLENEAENLATVTCNLKWYFFDLKNRAIYLIFVGNVIKPLQFKYLDFALNHELSLRFFKLVYTALSLMLKIRPHLSEKLTSADNSTR